MKSGDKKRILVIGDSLWTGLLGAPAPQSKKDGSRKPRLFLFTGIALVLTVFHAIMRLIYGRSYIHWLLSKPYFAKDMMRLEAGCLANTVKFVEGDFGIASVDHFAVSGLSYASFAHDQTISQKLSDFLSKREAYDFVVVALSTNDVIFGVDVEEVSRGAETLVKVLAESRGSERAHLRGALMLPHWEWLSRTDSWSISSLAGLIERFFVVTVVQTAYARDVTKRKNPAYRSAVEGAIRSVSRSIPELTCVESFCSEKLLDNAIEEVGGYPVAVGTDGIHPSSVLISKTREDIISSLAKIVRDSIK